jgi:hypothetical protein
VRYSLSGALYRTSQVEAHQSIWDRHSVRSPLDGGERESHRRPEVMYRAVAVDHLSTIVTT